MNDLACAVLALFSLALPASGGEDQRLPWPDYRGPRCDGDAGAARVPLDWSEEKNVRWKTGVHGRGWSSPVVAEGRVWITTATEDGRELSVLALDLEDGEIVHDAVVFEVEDPQHRNALNSYASPSPVASLGHVYVHFGYAGTACLEAATGDVLWERRDLGCDHMEGPGSSPLLWRDLLILHVDGGDVQFVVALDAQSGKTRWRRERSAPLAALPAERRKAFSTPIVLEIEGQPELVSSGAEATCGYDPRDGGELWTVRHPGFSMSARPLAGQGLVFLNTGFMKPRLVAVRPGGRGDVTEERVAWSHGQNVPTMSSPVLADGLLYFVDDGGIATCLDALTGERIWRERLGGRHCASPLSVAERIYFFDREGATTVLAAGPAYEVLAKNELDAGFMASPAVAGDALLLRTETHVYRIEEKPAPQIR